MVDISLLGIPIINFLSRLGISIIHLIRIVGFLRIIGIIGLRVPV